MLFETLGQFGVWLAFVWLGAILSLGYDLFRINKKIYNNIFDFVYIFFSGFVFLYFMNCYNLGEFRLFLVFGLILGIMIEKLFMSKIVADIKKILYNCIVHKIKQNFNIEKLLKNAKSKKDDKMQKHNKKNKCKKSLMKIKQNK